MKCIEKGFTLVELLIAMLVFSILSTFAFRSISMLSESSESIMEETQLLSDVQSLFRVWESDLRQSVLGGNARHMVPTSNSQTNDAEKLLVEFMMPASVGRDGSVSVSRVRYYVRDESLFKLLVDGIEKDGRSSHELKYLTGVKEGNVELVESGGGKIYSATLSLTHESLGSVERKLYLGLTKADLRINTLNIAEGLMFNQGGGAVTTPVLSEEEELAQQQENEESINNAF